MKRHKEAALIVDSLTRIVSIGKSLYVLFAMGAALFLILTLFGILGAVSAVVGGSSVSEHLTWFSALVQDIVMLYSLVVCAAVAWDASRSHTPFSRKQVRRVLSVGWALLAYTLFCLVLDPLAAQVQYAAGVAAISLFGSSHPGELFVNFETLIAAGAFFLFAYILDYGKTLQELADETA